MNGNYRATYIVMISNSLSIRSVVPPEYCGNLSPDMSDSVRRLRETGFLFIFFTSRVKTKCNKQETFSRLRRRHVVFVFRFILRNGCERLQ